MKPILPVLLLLLSLPSLGAAGLPKTLAVESPEIYVRVHPRDGYLQIREYALSTTAPAFSPEEIKTLVRHAGYCRLRFAFEHFTAMEESLKRESTGITGDYNLLTRERNVVVMLKDCFSRILARSVRVTVDERHVGVWFEGDDIVVRTNNAEGVYGKGRERVIFWKNGSPYYEVVLGEAASSDAKSIAAVFGDDASSPIKTETEINAWKNASSPTTR